MIIIWHADAANRHPHDNNTLLLQVLKMKIMTLLKFEMVKLNRVLEIYGPRGILFLKVNMYTCPK